MLVARASVYLFTRARLIINIFIRLYPVIRARRTSRVLLREKEKETEKKCTKSALNYSPATVRFRDPRGFLARRRKSAPNQRDILTGPPSFFVRCVMGDGTATVKSIGRFVRLRRTSECR